MKNLRHNGEAVDLEGAQVVKAITPDIGRVVLRYHNGLWTEDWVRLVRIDHGADPQNAEIGVAMWSTNDRHKPGQDIWQSAPTCKP